jgi:hypothetical protein
MNWSTPQIGRTIGVFMRQLHIRSVAACKHADPEKDKQRVTLSLACNVVRIDKREEFEVSQNAHMQSPRSSCQAAITALRTPKNAKPWII